MSATPPATTTPVTPTITTNVATISTEVASIIATYKPLIKQQLTAQNVFVAGITVTASLTVLMNILVLSCQVVEQITIQMTSTSLTGTQKAQIAIGVYAEIISELYTNGNIDAAAYATLQSYEADINTLQGLISVIISISKNPALQAAAKTVKADAVDCFAWCKKSL
jgi:hypothetical protein